MDRLVSLTIRAHDAACDSPSSFSQSRLDKAEKALENERRLVAQLQFRLQSNTGSEGVSSDLTDDRARLSAELSAAKSQQLTQQVELERLRRRASESEGEISSLREKLKRQEMSGNEGRDLQAKVMIRAAEDRALLSEQMYTDLQRQYDSAASMVEKLMADNVSLTHHTNNQSHRIKTLLVENKKKEATVAVLENLMLSRGTKPSLLTDVQEAVSQAFKALPGLGQLMEDLQGQGQSRSRGHRRCSSNMIEGVSADEWMVQQLQQDVEVAKQLLDEELRIKGQDATASTLIESNQSVKGLAQALSIMEKKLDEVKLLPLPQPLPSPSPLSEDQTSLDTTHAKNPIFEDVKDPDSPPQAPPAAKGNLSLWGWLWALDVED